MKRKGTKNGRSVPSPKKFVPLKENFLQAIQTVVTKEKIPLSMVVNFDQTGVNIVPTSNWTLHQSGASQVPIAGIDDKRQITMVLANTPTGHLLPPQVIYAGTTERCHPTFNFPPGWHITHTKNHWSNESTTLELIEKVLVPYFSTQRTQHGLPEDHHGLVILDVFAAHRTAPVRQAMEDAHINLVYVPAGCTGLLQPLDVSGNGTFKDSLEAEFAEWYAAQIRQQITDGVVSRVNMQLSFLKPKHANWLVQAFSKLQARRDMSINGWRQAGILEVLPEQAQPE